MTSERHEGVWPQPQYRTHSLSHVQNTEKTVFRVVSTKDTHSLRLVQSPDRNLSRCRINRVIFYCIGTPFFLVTPHIITISSSFFSSLHPSFPLPCSFSLSNPNSFPIPPQHNPLRHDCNFSHHYYSRRAQVSMYVLLF